MKLIGLILAVGIIAGTIVLTTYIFMENDPNKKPDHEFWRTPVNTTEFMLRYNECVEKYGTCEVGVFDAP